MNNNPNYNKKNLLSNFTPSSFAVITGASSGLGKEFAYALGKCGINTLLIARRGDIIMKISKDLTEKFKTKNEIYVVNLADLNQVEKLADFLSKREDIKILINNAGFGLRGLFHEIEPYKELNMMMVHMICPARLIRAILPNMIKNNCGVIINVSSLAAFINYFGASLYSSTKRFLVELSKSLKFEINNPNIKIQALCPGFVHTEFHSVGDYSNFSEKSIPKFLWMNPDKVVEISLKSLEKNKIIVIPGTKNKFFKLIFEIPIINYIIKKIISKKAKKIKLT